jgi:hypothetical protein
MIARAARTGSLAAALGVLAALGGCTESHGTGDGSTTDADGDGYPSDVDCDDADPATHPGAWDDRGAPPCTPPGDGEDDDCDGRVDEGISSCNPFPDGGFDGDGDGFAAPADCDDRDPTVFPGAPDWATDTICETTGDGRDDDCDGTPDDDHIICNRFDGGPDLDRDGYASDRDCDDADAAVHPGAEESCCDRVDSDCDGVDDPSGWACNCFYDADGDGWGEGAGPGPDCDDTNAAVHPEAQEICESRVDEDCDARVDERPCLLLPPADGGPVEWVDAGVGS